MKLFGKYFDLKIYKYLHCKTMTCSFVRFYALLEKVYNGTP